MGKPVIATAVGGNPELVRSGVDGLLVPYGDLPSLCAAMRRLHAEPALRQRLGAAGRMRFVECFTAERMLERLEAVYGMYAYASFRLIPSANRLLMYVNLMRFGRGRCHPLESWEGYAHDAFQGGSRAGLVEAALGGQNEHARAMALGPTIRSSSA